LRTAGIGGREGKRRGSQFSRTKARAHGPIGKKKKRTISSREESTTTFRDCPNSVSRFARRTFPPVGSGERGRRDQRGRGKSGVPTKHNKRASPRKGKKKRGSFCAPGSTHLSAPGFIASDLIRRGETVEKKKRRRAYGAVDVWPASD